MSDSRNSASDSRSIPELVRGVVASGQRYALAQKALVQAEMKRAGRDAGLAGAFAAVAIVMASMFLIFLLLTIAWALVQLGLQTWAGFGIVTLVLLIITVVMAALAAAKARAVRGPQMALKNDVAQTAADIRNIAQG